MLPPIFNTGDDRVQKKIKITIKIKMRIDKIFTLRTIKHDQIAVLLLNFLKDCLLGKGDIGPLMVERGNTDVFNIAANVDHLKESSEIGKPSCESERMIIIHSLALELRPPFLLRTL